MNPIMAEGLALDLPTAEILELLPTEGLHAPYHKPDAAVFVVMKKPAWGLPAGFKLRQGRAHKCFLLMHIKSLYNLLWRHFFY